MSPAAFVSGTIFAGDYRIERPLASGGMGTVYVAEQLSTGRKRALKLLNPEVAHDMKTRERFEQEARVASRIQSEHVVEVIAAGVDEESNTPWLAMELLEGIDLAALLAKHGALAPEDVHEILTQLCHALTKAHEAGVVHRDLKPENVFLARPKLGSARFVVKVLDFGIAKVVEEASSDSVTTSVLGTPRWMAPEQTKEGGLVTPATDIWTLGLLTFHLLTGNFYWQRARGEGSNVVALLREILFDPIVLPSQRAAEMKLGHLLPPGFDAWFARCVERDQSRRFRNAAEAWAALEPLLAAAPGSFPASLFRPRPFDGFPTGGAPAGEGLARAHTERAPRAPVPRKIWPFALLAAVVAAGALAATALLWPSPAAPSKKGEPAPDIAGSYMIAASQNPGRGGSYGGTVHMTRAGSAEVYRIAWMFPTRPGDEGIALLEGRTLGVAWGCTSGCSVAVYQIAGRKLRGRSVSADSLHTVRTEDLEGPASLNGTFNIVHSSAGASGTVAITPKGDTYTVTWTTSRGTFHGVGLKNRSALVVASTAPGRGVGIVSYDVAGPRKLVGRFGRLNDGQTGTETLIRQ